MITVDNPDQSLNCLALLQYPSSSDAVRSSELDQITSKCASRGISDAVATIIYGIMKEDGWKLSALLAYIGNMVKEDDPYEYLRSGTDCTRY